MTQRASLLDAIYGSAAIFIACYLTRRVRAWLAKRDQRRVNLELAAVRRADELAWRDFVKHHRLRHRFVRWNHCDDCYRTFERRHANVPALTEVTRNDNTA